VRRCISCLHVQLIIMGKISAGILLASAAYRAPPEFRKLTGIDQAQLLTDPVSDTTVHSISQLTIASFGGMLNVHSLQG